MAISFSRVIPIFEDYLSDFTRKMAFGGIRVYISMLIPRARERGLLDKVLS